MACRLHVLLGFQSAYGRFGMSRVATYIDTCEAFSTLYHSLRSSQVLVTIWLVVRRRLYPPTLDDLREDIKRSEDVEQTATNLTQLIEQHGSRGWVDALITDLGPRSLLQLTDAADSLEIMRK